MRAIRHTGIVVNNLQKCLHFYRNILGLRIRQDMAESGKYIDDVLGLNGAKVRTVKMSAKDGSLIELLKYEPYKGKALNRHIYDRGYSHIAFTVRDLDCEYAKLKKKGIKFISSPRISSSGKAKVVFCRDPEGNFIELVEVLS